jgi:hypothetical protein
MTITCTSGLFQHAEAGELFRAAQHLQVGDHDLKGLLFQQRQRGAELAGGRDLVMRVAQAASVYLLPVGVVLDDQYAWSWHRFPLP